MFRSFVYIDTDKFYDYYSLIKPDIMEKLKSKQKTIGKEVSLGIGSSGVKIASENSAESTVSSSFLYDYNNFEEELLKLREENFFDLDEDDYDLSTIPRMALVKLRTNIFVPEEFDFIDMVNKFKPMLMNEIDVSSGNEQAAFEAFMGDMKADIPVIIDLDEFRVCGKLDSRFMNESYTSLEDYESDEVTVLFKVLSRNSKKSVEIFNPYKDFIKLNRAMRRSMNINPDDDFSPINVEGPVLKVELIAIYS